MSSVEPSDGYTGWPQPCWPCCRTGSWLECFPPLERDREYYQFSVCRMTLHSSQNINLHESHFIHSKANNLIVMSLLISVTWRIICGFRFFYCKKKQKKKKWLNQIKTYHLWAASAAVAGWLRRCRYGKLWLSVRPSAPEGACWG